MTEYRRLAITAPPSTNDLWAVTWHGGIGKSNAYTKWLKIVGGEMLAQRLKPLAGAVHLTIRAPRNGRRDIDNYIKPTLDALVKNGLIEGDRMKTVKSVHATWHDDPAMLVEILGAIV